RTGPPIRSFTSRVSCSAAATSPWRCTAAANCAGCWKRPAWRAPRRPDSVRAAPVRRLVFAPLLRFVVVPAQLVGALFGTRETFAECIADRAEQLGRAFGIVARRMRRVAVPAEPRDRGRLGQHRLAERRPRERRRIEARERVEGAALHAGARHRG